MSRRRWSQSLLLAVLALGAGVAAAEDTQSLKRQSEADRQFKAAAAEYDAGKFPEAAAQLEELSVRLPRSFEVHELLGLVYAAQSLDAKAIGQLEAAARLKPDSAAARTNLAASLAHAGNAEEAEAQFRRALALEPRDFEANHDLGEFYIRAGKIADATPLLQQAQRINPSSYDNGYDLAQAYFLTDRLTEARQLAQNLLGQKNTGELHNLLAQIEEKDGKFVAAANEYETAAHMDPSEENLFDWGSEYLLHRTYEPAIDIFQQAIRRYPTSPRLLIGLGMALYSRGKNDEAVRTLIAAAALDPADGRCYMLLSKAYDSSPNQADEVVRTFRRFSDLQPGNAMAQYYYAMSLWKGKPAGDASPDLQLVESLLQKSIALDGSFADAHFQLGNLYADRHEPEKSVAEYERALELNPNLADAHYRLGQYYVHAGDKGRAQAEFAVYQRLRAERQAELDKQAAEVQQFVYSAKGASSPKQ